MDLTLYAADITVAGREGGEELLLLFLELLIGLIDRKIEIRRQGRSAPGFSHLVVVTKGVVVTREHQDDDCCKERKNAQAQDDGGVFAI